MRLSDEDLKYLEKSNHNLRGVIIAATVIVVIMGLLVLFLSH